MIWSGLAWVFPICMGCITILSPLRLGKMVPSLGLWWTTPTPDTRPRHADVCSPPLLVLRCGKWRHTISGPIHSVDMWRFCRPIGSDCCWQISQLANQQIMEVLLTSMSKYSPHLHKKNLLTSGQTKHPPFASCRKSCRGEYGPSNAQQYVHDGQWPDWELILAKCPDRVNYPDFHTLSEDYAAWIINLQTGRRASVSVSFIISPIIIHQALSGTSILAFSTFVLYVCAAFIYAQFSVMTPLRK
jgi:hypothetical protein